MVTSVGNISGLNRLAGLTKVGVVNDSKANNQATAASDPVLQISGEATTLSSIYEAANQYIQKESVKPLSGSGSDVELSYILDVKKYNDYVFDKAATAMVGEAQKVGVALKKEDVISQLRESNSTIASYKTNLDGQQHKLANSYMSKFYDQSDLDNITNFYIKAKESDLPDIVTISYANTIGMAKRDQALGIKSYSGEKYLVNDEAVPPSGISESVAEAAKKVYGHFGLSNMAVNMMAASYIGPEDKSGNSQAFEFLLKMLGEKLGSDSLLKGMMQKS